MRTFTAYFDASGGETTSVVSVAGFVARTERWQRFEHDWRSLLSVNPNIAHFHMTDFVSRQKGWSGWESADAKRLMDSLIDCIKKNSAKGFAVAISKTTFDAIDKEYELPAKFGSRYLITAGCCIGGLRRWAQRKGISLRKVDIVFELGDADQGDLSRMLAAENVDVRFVAKKGIGAFDAADLAAWKAKWIIDKMFEDRSFRDKQDAKANMLLSLNQLDKIVQETRFFQKNSLRRLCKNEGIPTRHSSQVK